MLSLPKRWPAGTAALLFSALLAGCVTPAEHRKLERRVIDLERGGSAAGSGARQRLADMALHIEELEQRNAELAGRLEVAEYRLDEVMAEARAARREAAELASLESEPPGEEAEAEPVEPGVGAEELEAYQAAYAARRDDDPATCIDRFRKFLQTYGSSPYADDAAYWMADCYFEQGDFKTAVLRFDDVVTRYPSGNRAADALYRQGEALLRMGPSYGSAAGKAFEKVLVQYPDSERASDAKRQLELLGAG